MKNYLKIIVIFLSVIYTSCEAPEHVFSAEELKEVDSLYKMQSDSLELMLKLECDSIFNEDYKKMVDSLKDIRQREILDILSK